MRKPNPPSFRVVSQEFETVALDSISPHPRNVNEGDIGAIHGSIEHNGFYGAVLVQKSTRHIIAGKHRFIAAGQAGAKTIPAIIVDVDDPTALKMMLADNRTARLGHDDDAMLAELLAELSATEEGLAGTGFDADDLDALINDLANGGLNEQYSPNVGTVVYEPKETNHKPKELFDDTEAVKFEADIAAIKEKDIQRLLRARAAFFTAFNYSKIADYYAYQAGPDEKAIFERMALVLLDRDQLIENGFADLIAEVKEENGFNE